MEGGARPRIILVTDPTFGDDSIVRCVEAAARALPAGILCVQLRDKRRARVSLRVFAWRLRVVTRAVGALLMMNGDAWLARDVGADGVHLGEGAMPVGDARALCGKRAWISVAAHSDSAVRRGMAEGADAAIVSPVFASRSASPLSLERKQGRGLDALRQARAIARETGRMAICALGGIHPDNAADCARAGADGVAVIRALLASGDPERVARALHGALADR